MFCVLEPTCYNPTLGLSVRMQFTLPKVGKWSPPGLLKTQKTIWKVKSPRIDAFFISMESSWSRCPKWPRMGHLDICSPSYGQKKGRESNCQFDSRPLKVGNQPLPDVAWGSATRRWKALDEGYNFGWDLVPIRVRGEELWTSKVPRLQPETVSRLQLGSPGKNSHLDVASVESCRVYYMGEGGGFPRVRAVVSLVCQSARGLYQHPRVFSNVN